VTQLVTGHSPDMTHHKGRKMHKTVRRTLTATAVVGALVAAGSGLAFADTGSSNGGAPGGGSGLSGGPTHTQVVKGAPSVPLSDPTLGEGTVLPPVYNAVG
jgi:hypothetical protein